MPVSIAHNDGQDMAHARRWTQVMRFRANAKYWQDASYIRHHTRIKRYAHRCLVIAGEMRRLGA